MRMLNVRLRTARLAALADYPVLNTLTEADLQNTARFRRSLCNVSVSTVSHTRRGSTFKLMVPLVVPLFGAETVNGSDNG